MNFSQTCSLLSQYLKEKKGSFALGDINIGNNHAEGMATTKTMDLFPQQSGSVIKDQLPNNFHSSVHKSEPEASSQMTIFYGGQVIVFNDFPADKVKELMLLASKSSVVANTTCTIKGQVPNLIEPTNSMVSISNIDMIQDRAQGPTQTVTTGVPIARKASLTRFLEKRKDRITARGPYAKPTEKKSWLGLAAQDPAHLERLL